VVRTRGGLDGIARDVRAAVRELDPGLPAPELRTLDAVVGGSVARPRFRALLLALFAGQALLLAAVGLYGLVAYSVAQRTREIGLRMALGAGRGRIAALVMGQGARLAAVGAGLGLLLTPLLTLALRSELFGVGPFDALTFASVALLLAIVALLACYVPARRAARIDPMAALRSE
jgi:putative ABC transport system permease protein